MRWIWLLMTCIASSQPQYGTGPVFKFFRCSNDFTTQKVCFSRSMQSLRWLSFNVSCVYIVRVSLRLIGQQDLGYFVWHRPLLPIGWRIVQILRQRRRKTTNTAPTSQDKQHANPLLSVNNLTPLVTCRKK